MVYNIYLYSCRPYVNLATIFDQYFSEKLECATKEKIQSDDWEQDYDSLIMPLLEPKCPCYIIYRLQDEKNWILLCYIPDESQVYVFLFYRIILH